MAGLFDKTKAKKTSAKAEKVEVVIDDPKFHVDVVRLATINEQVDKLTAEAAVIAGTVKERGIKEFIKLYAADDKYPGSFNIVATGLKGQANGSFMFIPTDRYLKIDEERYAELIAEFGEKIAEEVTTYTMDSTLVEKYGEIISDLITNCKDITESDKEKLISIACSYTVKKGTIQALDKFEGTIPELLEEIKPVYQLKGIKVDE